MSDEDKTRLQELQDQEVLSEEEDKELQILLLREGEVSEEAPAASTVTPAEEAPQTEEAKPEVE